MKIIPAVDILDGKVVRLLQGDYDTATEYSGDPAAAVRIWAETGAKLVHVVDLDGARRGTPDIELWESITGAGCFIQAGGGIRSAVDAAAVIDAGASRVVLGTTAVWDPKGVREIVGAVGPEHVVAAVDVRDGNAAGEGWEDKGRKFEEVVTDLVSAGVERALVTSISRDGMMTGPDIELLGRFVTLAPGIDLIASGGVGTLHDLRKLAASGLQAVIVGRAFYEGRFTYAEALTAIR